MIRLGVIPIVKWFDVSETVSIRVSLEGRPFRLDFYDYETVESISQTNDEKRLEEGKKIATHLNPKGKDFLGKTRHSGIKDRLTDSDLGLSENKAKDIINNFGRMADREIREMLEQKSQKETKDRLEEESEWDEDYIEEEAEEWINSPELLSKIDRAIHHHLAGETKNSLLVFLMVLSTKTQKSGSLRPIGKAAVGKSYIVENVAKLFPSDMIVMRTAFSKMAPWNKAKPTDVEGVRDWDLRGKCIIIKEEENSEDFLKQFRDVLARNDPVNIYEVTNTESQKRETLKVRMIGWPSYIGLRVDPLTEEQESSRAMCMTPNAGEEKYSKSQWFVGRKEQNIWEDDLRERDTMIIRKAIEKLDRYRVIVPHLDDIQKHFPASQSEHQRHYQYFLALIRAMTILHQEQRPVIEVEDEKCIISVPDDVKAVLHIAEKALSETISGLDNRAQRFWERIKDIGGIEGYSGLQDVYRDLFGERVSKTTMKRKFIDPLDELNLLSIDEGSGRNPNLFTAKGTLSTLSSNFEKIKEACSKREIEDSWFHDLLRNKEHINGITIKNCPTLEKNPLEDPTMTDFKEVWQSCMDCGVLHNNQKVLNKGYEEDYGVNGRNKELEDKEDKDEKKEEDEVPSVGEIVGEEENPPEVEDLGEEPQEELIEKLHDFYLENYDPLETPHIKDFSEVASERFDEKEERILEFAKRLNQEDNQVQFNMTRVDDD